MGRKDNGDTLAGNENIEIRRINEDSQERRIFPIFVGLDDEYEKVPFAISCNDVKLGYIPAYIFHINRFP